MAAAPSWRQRPRAAAGAYLFSDLAAGDYCVVIDAANRDPGGALAGYGSTTGGNRQDVALAAGEEALGVSFGFRSEPTPAPTTSPTDSPGSAIGQLMSTGAGVGLIHAIGVALLPLGVVLRRSGLFKKGWRKRATVPAETRSPPPGA